MTCSVGVLGTDGALTARTGMAETREEQRDINDRLAMTVRDNNRAVARYTSTERPGLFDPDPRGAAFRFDHSGPGSVARTHIAERPPTLALVSSDSAIPGCEDRATRRNSSTLRFVDRIREVSVIVP